MKNLIKRLKSKNQTIASMESCTGGYFANEITNIKNSSDVFKFGAITYSNDFKEKMGINKATIDKYTVYSIAVAKEMSKAISDFTASDYGIGITGKLSLTNQKFNVIYVALYSLSENKYYELEVVVTSKNRIKNKKVVFEKTKRLLKKVVG